MLKSSTPQFHKDPSVQHISSTHEPHLFSPQNPSVPHQQPLSSTQPPQFHTINPSVQHRNPLRSTQKTPQSHPLSSTRSPQFYTENPSVPTPPLSFTPKTPQFHTKKSSIYALYKGTEGFLVWNWGVFGVELRGGGTEGFLVWNWGVFGVELRGFRCWTEGFLVWNWGIFGAEKVWSRSGTDVLNWGGLCGTEGYSLTLKISSPMNFVKIPKKKSLVWKFRDEFFFEFSTRNLGIFEKHRSRIPLTFGNNHINLTAFTSNFHKESKKWQLDLFYKFYIN